MEVRRTMDVKKGGWRMMRTRMRCGVPPSPQDRVRDLEVILGEQRRMIQSQTERIQELEEDNSIYAEEVRGEWW